MCRVANISRETRYAIDVLVFLTVFVLGILVPRGGNVWGISASILYVVFVLSVVAVFAFNVAVRLSRLEDAVFGKKD